jgi:hypothetical protein
MNEFRDHQEKAASDILAHLSRLQHTHIVDCQDGPAWMWAMLKSVHLQRVPGMHFSAYNRGGHDGSVCGDVGVDAKSMRLRCGGLASLQHRGSS